MNAHTLKSGLKIEIFLTGAGALFWARKTIMGPGTNIDTAVQIACGQIIRTFLHSFIRKPYTPAANATIADWLSPIW